MNELKKTNIIATGDFQYLRNDEVKGPFLILGYFGIFLLVVGIITLLPLLVLIFYPSESSEFPYFLVPGAIALFLGLVLSMLIFRRRQQKLSTLGELVLIVGVWIIAIVFAAIPFMCYGYSFSQAMFESMSGYTSTGLSIINWEKEIADLDVVSHMLFFHRALIELVGGIGLVLIVVSAVSAHSGLNLYLLEGHNDKLLPNLVKSARLIFSIYLNYILVGSVLYISVGVTPFDAICHAMTAVATGGFSTKANNINTLVQQVSMNGAWRGVFVEIVSEILMLLGGTNFVIHYSLIKGKFKTLRHYEFIVFFAILVFIWPFMIIGTTQYYGGDFASGLRYGTFEMISAMSTCGFQGMDSYISHTINGQVLQYPTYALFLLGLLMCIGSQNGSTSGAIKQNRIGLMFMDIWWRVRSAVGKQNQVHIPTTYRFGIKTKVTRDEVIEAETYIALYMVILIFATVLVSTILSCMGLNFTFNQCFFEISSCLGTVGLGCGITGYSTHALILWIEIIVMFLGRLEIFCFFTLGGKAYQYFRHKKIIYDSHKPVDINKIINRK